ncbi:hypothetical protein N7G274_005332 [Stereocaulon virgatum]|uniref:Uncharacterized protein n=1 Tax=Stereocaulon virgatum TaxID=373712 RepID=A0ABR4A9K6_9LECA
MVSDYNVQTHPSCLSTGADSASTQRQTEHRGFRSCFYFRMMVFCWAFEAVPLGVDGMILPSEIQHQAHRCCITDKEFPHHGNLNTLRMPYIKIMPDHDVHAGCTLIALPLLH